MQKNQLEPKSRQPFKPITKLPHTIIDKYAVENSTIGRQPLLEKTRQNSRNPQSLWTYTLMKCKKEAKSEDPKSKRNSMIDKTEQSETRKTYSCFTSSLILEEDWLRSASVRAKEKENILSQEP